MSHLQYIIDCIEQIRLEGTESHSLEADDDYTIGFNNALQAVLSKIEEIEKGKCAKFLEEYEKRFPSSNITSDIEHKPVTREDIISKS